MDIVEMLEQDEGLKLKLYFDIKDNPSIGFGFNLNTFDQEDAYYFLNKKIEQAINFLKKYSWFSSLTQPRQDALTNMVYNLGIEGFEEFSNMIANLSRGNYELATQSILNSKAAKELPNRYSRIANIIKTGHY